MSSEGLRPRDAADLAEIVRSHPRPLEPIGGGSKRALGRPLDADLLDLSALAGIVNYEPAELVLAARCGTRLAEIEAALRTHGQRLAFEPRTLGRCSVSPRRRRWAGCSPRISQARVVSSAARLATTFSVLLPSTAMGSASKPAATL